MNTSKRINTLAELEVLYSRPLETSLKKELFELNDCYKKIIAASPFFAIASSGPEGMDCSPRGDSAGFVRVLDDRTLVIPDRPGNNRLDTLKNIVVDPRVALLFLIPGYHETLRVNGRAFLSLEEELLRQFEVNGQTPKTAIVVELEGVYFQCARALKRSRLWDHSSYADVASLPSAGTLLRSTIEGFDANAYDAALPERQARTLY